MTLFLKASSLYGIFTQVPATFHSPESFQESFFKRLGDVATVLLDLVSVFLSLRVIPDGLDNGEIRSVCGTLAVVRFLVDELIFPTDTYSNR